MSGVAATRSVSFVLEIGKEEGQPSFVDFFMSLSQELDNAHGIVVTFYMSDADCVYAGKHPTVETVKTVTATSWRCHRDVFRKAILEIVAPKALTAFGQKCIPIREHVYDQHFVFADRRPAGTSL